MKKRKEVNDINEKNKVNVVIIPNPELLNPKYKLTRYREIMMILQTRQAMSFLHNKVGRYMNLKVIKKK